jgi:undecaprenyl-phosphate galactose phosphotransferase/putative colanic acid biosynthesis UDP-glucose lipid carrier transferase
MTTIGLNPFGERATIGTAKRIGDLTIASALVILTLPLLAAAALAIKLDSAGPVLMREERRAGGGRITIFKFRTTRRPRRGGGPMREAQPTGIGRFLHYTRISDLPQLVNVLRGEMSLVGTGALRPDFLV